MSDNQSKRSEQAPAQPQPSDLNSFNNRDQERSTEVEKTKDKKDEQESYMDYNGNSEANAPARTKE